MKPGTQDILDRLPGVESRPRRVDRDARRALGALVMVTLIASTLAVMAREGDDRTVLDAAVPPSGPIDAIDRIRVDPESVEKATAGPEDRYESIDAIGPGRRS